jgi:hypothetical protein
MARHAVRFFTRFNMRVQETPIGDASAVRTPVLEMEGHEVPGIQLAFEWPSLSVPCATRGGRWKSAGEALE